MKARDIADAIFDKLSENHGGGDVFQATIDNISYVKVCLLSTYGYSALCHFNDKSHYLAFFPGTVQYLPKLFEIRTGLIWWDSVREEVKLFPGENSLNLLDSTMPLVLEIIALATEIANQSSIGLEQCLHR